MKTLTNVVYVIPRPGQPSQEQTRSFIRDGGRKPTHTGAARMVAREINDGNPGDLPTVTPAGIAVVRVEMMTYCR
jgi:hypothetical protein